MSRPSATVSDGNGSPLVSELGPRLELCPPIPIRPKNHSLDSEKTLAEEPTSSLPDASNSKSDDSEFPKTQDSAVAQQVLIVDDNAINRRLLSVFMKKRRLPFEEANDGLEALETYKNAEGRFDVILMDISM